MLNFIKTIDYLLLIILSIPAITLLMSIFFGKIRSGLKHSNICNHDFAVIITAYKNFTISLPAIESCLTQNYPRNKYHIYVVADDCSNTTVIKSNNLSLLKPELPLSSKIKSIKFAIDNFIRKPDYIIVLDADNLADTNYLTEMNSYTQSCYYAVQGKRRYKNLDTIYSCLDAAGETYYNYTQRIVPFKLGLSAAISGSGMAVKTDVFNRFLDTISNKDKIIIAEDKMLQNFLVNSNIEIAFAEDAIIYDEKISGGYQTERQRTRWLKSYFDNLKDALNLILIGIKKRDSNRLFFGIMTAYPPIITIIISTVIFSLINSFLNINGLFIIWFGWFIFTINFVVVLLLNKTKSVIWKSLFFIPFFAFRQFIALFNFRKAKIDFLATEHSKTISINEIIENK